ncbi:hypothetical protein QTH87_13090 [Variovorax sp. J22P168]|uniref:hypothetical protein n=1 Tax=Variovorax jilinensis TaxID=3053513 RepID=UPI00257834A6|nr:hypothetical protein [Variovorax sp. J22P168]MDM0013372.1 hypothetical protein [Variovorax sp. J22P168]
MFPWLWFWSPTLHLPFSGSVAQQIEPDTRWFFAGIPAEAGNGEIEKKAFEVASYGSQLGWITEVLLASASPGSVEPKQAARSLARLEKAHAEIEAVKKRSRAELAAAASNALAKLQEADPAAYEQLLAAAPRQSPRRLPR